VKSDPRTARASLLSRLAQLRNADGGWPYYRGRQSRLEPTCWAMLATGVPVDATPLARWTTGSGLLVEPSTGQVNYAFNGLAALAIGADPRRPPALVPGVVAGLVAAKGVAVEASPVIQLDTSLQGWSWIPETFTWVEPTAWCMLALKRWPGDPASTSARIEEAERVMRDRVCPGGGWNFGNGIVYGHALPAHVPPTAVGVLALQDRTKSPVVTDAIRFLERHALGEGSTTALALTTLAFAALGRPTASVIEALITQCAETDSLGNVAALGMAALALATVAAGDGPQPFRLPAPGVRP